MKLIKVLENDIDYLVTISQTTFIDTFLNEGNKENINKYLLEKMSKQSLINQINSDNTDFYFIYVNNNRIGYVKLIKKNQHLLLQRIYIKKQMQTKGYGSKTIDLIKDLYSNYNQIELNVSSSDSKAMNFYLKNGFSKVGSQQFILGDEIEIDYIMHYSNNKF